MPDCIGALHCFAGGAAAARMLGKAVAEAGARSGADVRELRAAVAAVDLLIWPFVLEHDALCSHVIGVSDYFCIGTCVVSTFWLYAHVHMLC